MKYISAILWRDLTDGHLYAEGDEFPFDGREIPEERLEMLESGRNEAALRFIRAVEPEAEPKEVPKEEEPEKAPAEAKKTAAKKAAPKKTTTKKPAKK